MNRPTLFHWTVLLCLLSLLLRTPLVAQNQQTMANPADTLYQEEWQLIDSLLQNRRSRSALNSVLRLQRTALANNHNGPFLRTVMYQTALIPELSQDGQVAAIDTLMAQVNRQEGVVRAVLQSITAETIAGYLSRVYWQISDRTFAPGRDSAQVSAWSPNRLDQTVTEYYLASLQPADTLRNMALNELGDILEPGEQTEGLRPTWYDLLVHRALMYFQSSRSYLQESITDFVPDQPELFAPAAEFVETDFGDASAKLRRAIDLYQRLLRFRLSDTSSLGALIDLDLKRLQFARQQAVMPEKDSLYLDALNRLSEAYGSHPLQALVQYYRAEFFQQQGNQYRPAGSDAYRYDLNKAAEICRACQEDYPATYGARRCTGLLAALGHQELSVQMEKVLLPQRPALLRVDFRNLTSFYLRILRFSETQYRDYQRAYGADREKIIADLEVVRTVKKDLPDTKDFQTHATEVMTAGLPMGQYLLLFSARDSFPTNNARNTGMLPFQVSRIGMLSRLAESNNNEFLLADRMTGVPLDQAEVTFWNVDDRDNWQKIGTSQADSRGLVQRLPEREQFVVRVQQGEDVLYSTNRFYNGQPPQPARTRRRIAFFLDRAIYRPGQTVFFKGLALKQTGSAQPEIVPGEELTVTLIDANYQEVFEQTFTTNEFGTFHGQFEAPATGLNGRMQLRVKSWNATSYFQVEEYKRPTFSVQMDSLGSAFQLGDTVLVSGSARTFSGSALANRTVTYTVKRSVRLPFNPWFSRPFFPGREQKQVIAVGETRTDADGQFAVRFLAEPDPTIPVAHRPQFLFSVTATITDLTGETHASDKRLNLGYQPFQLELDLPQTLVVGDGIQPIFLAKDAEGGQLDLPVTYQVARLQAPSTVFRERYWERPDLFTMDEATYREQFPTYARDEADNPATWPIADTLAQDTIRTGTTALEWPMMDWSAGHYVLKAIATDQAGREVAQRHFFRVVDPRNNRLPQGQLWWPDLQPKRAQPGDSLRLRLGSTQACPLLVEIETRRAIKESTWLDAGDWPVFSRAIAEPDRGGLHVLVTGLYDNRVYQQQMTIPVPWTNKDLSLTWETFRDRMKPGQEEEWRLRITGSDKDAVAAEMVATLYDASLDEILPHDWFLSLYPVWNYPSKSWKPQDCAPLSDQLLFPYASADPAGRRTYVQLRWPDYLRYTGADYSGNYTMNYRSLATEEASMAAPKASAPPPAPESYQLDAEGNQEGAEQDQSTVETSPPRPPGTSVRRNLKETVFFLPELRTDANGDILISFTMNEALTRWKFLGMAHTKNLAFGFLRDEIVTQKELMVQPNPPRFVRTGDDLIFTARVANLTEDTLRGEATLQLFDATTMEPLDEAFGLTQAVQSFSVSEKGSALVRWRLSVPKKGAPALTHRVMVRADQFADGEESTFPVLTNRLLVTETKPFSLRPGQQKEVTLSSLRSWSSQESSSLAPHQFTLEYTANPTWLAVQSMPYLMEFPHECAEQLFSRYYANATSAYLVNRFPRIQRVFAQWRESGELESNLMRNEALRSAILEETPWVLDAQSEVEQRKNIALLFDLDRMRNEQSEALAKLAEMQRSGGGFPWFPGGPENRYITQYIIAGMGRLQQIGVLSEADWQTLGWLEAALEYLDEKLVEDYQRLRQSLDAGETRAEDDHLTGYIVHALYARSFFLSAYPMKKATEEAWSYYSRQAEKHWPEKNLFAQGLLGQMAQRTDQSDLAQAIRGSLKERALRSEELGAYWHYSDGYRWNELPLETHALLMSFFAGFEQEKAFVDDLAIWLLKNKQTNHWKTTKATVSAIHALLCASEGDRQLADPPPATVRFPGWTKKAYQPKLSAAQAQAQAGTGYWKAQWSADEVVPDLGTIRVENKGEVVTWGGMYWQYFADLDKISSFRETPLQLSKTLYRRVYAPSGTTLVPVEQEEVLAQGTELVVRLQIDVDRPMEYLHLKDMRAAGCEPLTVLSRYQYQDGLGYYQSTRDLATHFFIDYLPRGTYVLEYPLRVTHSGTFSNGISSLQCMYAPEFSTHTEGQVLRIDE